MENAMALFKTPIFILFNNIIVVIKELIKISFPYLCLHKIFIKKNVSDKIE